MFTHEMTLKMKHTDAAGVAFFASYFVIAHDCYELALESVGVPLGVWLTKAPMPLVHSEAQYHTPVRLGDRLKVNLSVHKLSVRSFELHYELWVKPLTPLPWASDESGQGGWSRAAMLKTVHVAIDPTKGKSAPLPEAFKEALERLGGLEVEGDAP